MLYELDDGVGRDEVLDGLTLMPELVVRAVAAASPVALTRHVAPGEWSAFQVCCHVRDAALVYSARFRWIVFDDSPVLPNYDENNWVAASMDTVDDLAAMLKELAASRSDLMRVLRRLPEAAWQRAGRHEVIGTVRLEEYVRHQLAHERMHLAQIESALHSSSSVSSPRER